MRYTCAQLQVVHPLPNFSKVIQNGKSNPLIKVPVGIAIFSEDEDKCWLNLINAPEAIRWLVIFASLPADKESLIHAVDTARYPLAIRYEACECYDDEAVWLDSKRRETHDEYHRISQLLNREVYGRN
jgi:hypothetical protein